MRNTLSISSLVCFIAIHLSGIARADTTRVLFIGNSYTYTNDLPNMFRLLALSLGDTVETGMSAPGGYTFQQHTTNTTTQAAIAQGDWDFVVLQEQSQLPSFSPAQVAAEVYPFATQLVQQIQQANPCTETIFLMTWGRENGDASNCASYPPVCTYSGMQQRLYESYVAMAEQNSAWCAPVGAVWRAYRDAQPTAALYTDGSHPNVLGTYIAANTLVSTIFRHATVDATYAPGALSNEQITEVRTLASEVVADSAATWNIGVNDPLAQFNWTDLGNGAILFANNTMGAAQQQWSFGDGSTSTDFDPQHTYGGTGTYLVELSVEDDCGRTGSASSELAIIISTVPERDLGRDLNLQYDQALQQIMVTSINGPATVELFDIGGRKLYHGSIHGSTRTITLQRSFHGLLFWTLGSQDGLRRSGRFVIP